MKVIGESYTPVRRCTTFTMSDGEPFVVNRFGWVFDGEGRGVPHPKVDEVQEAIELWERRNR